MALSCHDTAHGATCVFVFGQWIIIAMQIREEWLPKHLMFSRIQWVGSSSKDQFFQMNQIGWFAGEDDFFILIDSKVFPTGNTSIVGVQVCSVLSLYCTGRDHHKAQTGGAIWSSLKPSPRDWEVVVGWSGAPLWWMSPGSGQGTITMDWPLNGPPIQSKWMTGP